ncbi:ABC transporter substrate-binding protein [Actinospica robiniae]|uniref:ABC transporter substrate-binding protein n=1 Tax=Actinospica robiniae TaxID=304901 RepID=UPI0004177614|nr:extracellular solute-binding protein [Actinospica robiniae]
MKKTAIARGAAALGLLIAAAGCGTAAQTSAQVTIMVPWSGTEFDAFYRVIQDFQNSTHIHVNVEVTRAQTEQLAAAVGADAPPDLAVLPSVGEVDQDAKAGALQPIQGVASSDFLEPFSGLMTVDGKVYAVPVKADVKSLIWYDPQYTAAPPADVSGLQTLAAGHSGFWCLGVESGPTSGWPGADWIADLYLAKNGTTAYENWLTGTSAQWQTVRGAWTEWADLVDGSTKNAATTPFGDAAAGMTANSRPRCELAHGALAAMAFSSDLKPGKDYDFVAPASSTPLEVSADFLGMFTRDNPAAVTLMQYLTSKSAQIAWVKGDGYAFSANKEVPNDVYPGPVEQRIAGLLRPSSGHPLCFGAADMMTPDMSTAFYQAVMNFVEAPTPRDQTITGLLDGLQTSQTSQPSDTPQISPGAICSSPS